VDTVNAAAMLLIYGTPVMILVCFAAWAQQRPAKGRQAEVRAKWAGLLPYVQLGVHIRMDGFVYANATGRCLGQATGSSVELFRSAPVGRCKPKTGWAVITFADGTTHRHMFGLRDLTEAQAQAKRFNGQRDGEPAGVFARTNPAGRNRSSHA
jgi:hypothetical protein